MKDEEKRCLDCVHNEEHLKAIQEGKRGSAICMLECNASRSCFEPIRKMKDEEMAEEYAYEKWTDYPEKQEIAEQAFLAGLKAGRPQWHDLRKANNCQKEGGEKSDK